MEALLSGWNGHEEIADESVVVAFRRPGWQPSGPPRKRTGIFRPPARPRAAEFEELATEWERETALMAFVERKAMHWAYQRIIGMGDDAVPLMLRRLAEQEEPEHWFWALTAITGRDAAEGAETLEDAAKRWVLWGHQAGLI
jgi:hypothetical protein